VAHVVIGIQVHMGNPWLYFFRQVGPAKHLVLRGDLFGWTNYAGLVATLLLVFLLALSNDWSLHVMGAARWKAWQSANYILFALVAVHGVLFQVIEKRRTGWVITLGLMLAVVLGARLAAIVNARTPGLGRWPR
jgi:sulfoxide reductase heme-binding subunit YedZ